MKVEQIAAKNLEINWHVSFYNRPYYEVNKQHIL